MIYLAELSRYIAQRTIAYTTENSVIQTNKHKQINKQTGKHISIKLQLIDIIKLSGYQDINPWYPCCVCGGGGGDTRRTLIITHHRVSLDVLDNQYRLCITCVL